jgi:hypothetical protein
MRKLLVTIVMTAYNAGAILANFRPKHEESAMAV